MTKQVEERQRVVIRFAGDSGDGMQLTGDRFTNATAVLGNDLATLPDFPAEIRAPAGTVHGVSAFQIQFASTDILTPGDHPGVLVAMNPAALKAELGSVEKGGVVIVNEDAFTDRNLQKAGLHARTRSQDGTLDGYQLFKVPMTSITVRAVEELGLSRKEAERSKNMFALGLVSWMFGRPVDVTLNWLHKKFGDKPQVFDANVAAFKAGYNFGETTELFATSYIVKPAPAKPGTYRNVSGATALAWGLIAASERSGLRLFYASYPITPASELLHELSRHKNFGVITLQAEDEIAAANVAVGRGLRRRPRGHGDERARHGPQGRDARARGDPRAADGHRRRPARRSLDGDADEDRAGRPAAVAVRPARRVADADRRGQVAEPLLRRRRRGRADRGHVPDAGDPALGHVPRELVRAVADPEVDSLPRIDPNFATGPERGPGVPPVPARREARPAVGGPRDAGACATASAGSSGRTAPATSATTR